MEFEWDTHKNTENIKKHDVSFEYAQYAFSDSKRIITIDEIHSTDKEERYFCFGKIDNAIYTVRFVIRNNKIRIFGAGKWRQGRKRYEQENLSISSK